MHAFFEHYLPAEPAAAYLAPGISMLAEIWFDITEDVQSAVQRWEQTGFTRLDVASENQQERATFCRHAVSIAASLVIYRPPPSPPEPVYLAPQSMAARRQAELAPRYGAATIVIDSIPAASSAHIGPKVCQAARVSLVQTAELPGMLATWQNKGFVVLGSSDLLIKNNEMGFSEGLRQAAVAAGASLAFFQITPAKVRAVQRKADGRIDMDAVRADPPVKMSPGGSSVLQLVLLAPVSLHARELAEAEFGSSHVPIGLGESSPVTAPPATLKTSW